VSGRSEPSFNTVNQRSELTPEERRARFRVVRGEPSDAEVAALTVVLAAVAARGGGPGGTRATPVRDLWSDPAARLRTPLHPGPGAWRASAWPR
jgi:hypothetical protein